uniref:Calcium uniporter protein n=1 Tax=Parascaris univalens TaxID=6257 RepID=A0A915B6M4_PARUN
MRLQLLCAARCATCNRILYLRSFSTHLLLRGSTQRSPILLHTRPCLAKTQESAIAGIVTMRYERGLPVISIPLPSRREICQFSLKPISDTVFNLCNYLAAEDKGIDFVAFYTIGKLPMSPFMNHSICCSVLNFYYESQNLEIICIEQPTRQPR